MVNKDHEKIQISAVVIAKNSQNTIAGCIKSLIWTDEIIVVDNGSTDKTIDICKRLGCKVYRHNKGSYPDWRNVGKEKAGGRFLIYLDTDEVISGNLKNEIQNRVDNWPDGVACFAIPRKNIVFGRWLKHGGWYPDHVIRLFEKKNLIRWENKLHEQPKYSGSLEYLEHPIIHYKEKTLGEMLVKTNKWSGVEAKLMYDSNHPPMTITRFLSAMFREFWLRFIINLAFLDGGEGIIMGIYQVYSRFISYAKLWELQIKDIHGSRTDLH